MAIELSVAAFRSSLPPENFCLAQTPTRGCVLPTICVVGVAYGLLSLDVTRSSRSLRFFLCTCSWLSASSWVRDLFRYFRGAASADLLEFDDLRNGLEGEK